MLGAIEYIAVQTFWISMMAAAACFVLLVVLKKTAVLDQPNERSMHAVPTPRGGGLALVLVILLTLLGPLLSGSHQLPSYADTTMWALAFAVILLSAVSFWDDRRPLSPILRLLTHFIAVAVFLAFFLIDFMTTSEIPFIHPALIVLLPLFLLFVFLWAGFMNIVNFMDGIDGITCVELGCIALGIIMTAFVAGVGRDAAYFSHILLGCCLAFLFFNWHPAKMFLGDVGSIPMGFFTGFMLLVAATEGLWLPALILPLYYVADGGITLLRRLLRGEKVWHAHREHFYQRAAMAVGRHDIIVFWVLLTNIALIAISCLAVAYNPWFSLLAPATVATLLLHMERAASRKLPTKNK